MTSMQEQGESSVAAATPGYRAEAGNIAARLFFITGKVQGVFFRSATQEQARSLGLAGWVRNVDDGSVEAYAEGAPEKLDALEKWLWRGPEQARVNEVIVKDVEPASADASPEFAVRQ